MTTQELPDHVTLPLLDRLSRSALDADYETVARRRTTSGGPSVLGRVPVLVVLALFGLLVATAFAQTKRDATVSANGRATLIQQISEQKAALDSAQAQAATLRREVSGLQVTDNALSAQNAKAASALRKVQTPSGFSAVRGPGVQAVVNDAPSGVDHSNLVRGSDLAFLVNGFWAAGAEAISINGQRLTSLSAIRNSGWAIHVNGRGLAAPYTVDVIGDPAQLQARLLQTTTGQLWFAIVRQVGFEFSMSNVKNLSLPAAPDRVLQNVRPLVQPGAMSKVSGGKK